MNILVMPRMRLTYRQIIDVNSQGRFERNVFNDTYEEFKMQAQVYNPGNKFKTLSELTASNPKANSLHYKVGFAIGLYVKDLNSIIPGLTDSVGRKIVPFANYTFEILESDITNKSAHRIALTFTSDELTLHHSLGEYIVLSAGEIRPDEGVHTFMLRMQKDLGVSWWKEEVVTSPYTFPLPSASHLPSIPG